jgi:hypothetical protein
MATAQAAEEDQHKYRIDEQREGERADLEPERPATLIGASHVVCVVQ